MKLQRLSVHNFKGVSHVEIDLTSGGSEPRQLTCLLGDNGSGKTTVLQAVALIVSLATRRTRRSARLNWHGFLPERVGSLGRSRVTADIVFDQEEIETTLNLYREWFDTLQQEWRRTHVIHEPSTHSHVTLIWEAGKLQSPQGPAAINQFLGRYYIRQLLESRRRLRRDFRKVGDVFWFDQHRNLGSALTSKDDGVGGSQREGWKAGVEQLREFLVGWWGYHTSETREGGRDYIQDLEHHLNEIFPGTKFRGIKPKEEAAPLRAKDFYFLLEREGRVYDLAEMSSGEQAVFPLIYEFVRLDIAKSLVLIDELELHLHPPQQQALLGALPRIGRDCQFIITTHSPYLADVIPTENEVRLDGGRRSL